VLLFDLTFSLGASGEFKMVQFLVKTQANF
jgi:hypothetical protein